MHTSDNIYKPIVFLTTVVNIIFIVLLTQYTPAGERSVAIFYNLFYHSTDAPIYSNNVLATLPYKPYLYVFYLVSFLLVIFDVAVRYQLSARHTFLSYFTFVNVLPVLNHIALTLSFTPVLFLSGIITLDRIFMNLLIVFLSSTLISPLLQAKSDTVEISVANFRYPLIGMSGFVYVYVTCIVNIAFSPIPILRTQAITMLALQLVLTAVYVLSVIDIASKFGVKSEDVFGCIFRCRQMYVLTHVFIGCLFTFIVVYMDKKNNTLSLRYDHGILDVIS